MCLGRDHQIGEALCLAKFDVFTGRTRQLLRERKRCIVAQVRIKRTGVHADTNGDTCLFGRFEHRNGCLEAADVTRVDAQFRSPTTCRLDGKIGAEMDIRHHGKHGACTDLLEIVEIGRMRNSNTDDVAACLRHPFDLREVLFHFRKREVEHGLHGAGRSPANRHVAHHNLMRYFVRQHGTLLAPIPEDEALHILVEHEHEEGHEQAHSTNAQVV